MYIDLLSASDELDDMNISDTSLKEVNWNGRVAKSMKLEGCDLFSLVVFNLHNSEKSIPNSRHSIQPRMSKPSDGEVELSAKGDSNGKFEVEIGVKFKWGGDSNSSKDTNAGKNNESEPHDPPDNSDRAG